MRGNINLRHTHRWRRRHDRNVRTQSDGGVRIGPPAVADAEHDRDSLGADDEVLLAVTVQIADRDRIRELAGVDFCRSAKAAKPVAKPDRERG